MKCFLDRSENFFFDRPWNFVQNRPWIFSGSTLERNIETFTKFYLQIEIYLIYFILSSTTSFVQEKIAYNN